MTAPVDVAGGAGGITANRSSIEHVAVLHANAAASLWLECRNVEQVATAVGSGMFGGDFGDAGQLDLAGLVAARTALDDAVVGLRHAEREADDLATKLRWAAQGYPWGSNALDAGVLNQVNGLLGALGPTSVLGVAGLVATRGPVDESTSVVGQDPRTVDTVIGLAGPAAIAELVSGDGDGLGVAIATGTAVVAPPRGLADLVGGLGTVDRTGAPGGIDVRILTDAAGQRHVVVDITGTRVWLPGGRNPADLTTNARALGGHNTAYSQGVLAALRQAGVRRDDPVMLVGHSQGGMVAVNTAAELARTGEFRVTHVVTAGSPIGIAVARLPSSVRVLALENNHDVVPRLDGRANPDRRSVTTVSGSYGNGSVGDSHSITSSYQPLAAAAERDGGRSVREFLAGAKGYFRAVSVEQHSYRVERR